MKKNQIAFMLLAVVFLLPLAAQEGAGESFSSGPEAAMRRGLDLFKAGQYEPSLYLFREITLESRYSDYHGSAYFWIAKAYLAMNNWELAEENLDFFLKDFPGHPFYEEGYYQKGRILFLSEKYQESIGIFYDFLEKFPDSAYKANSLFWIGESLFILGHYGDAAKLFNQVITEYPSSFKVETAKYRLSLIDIFDREEVLLDLLKLSHEEYIGSLEEFQRRERTYEQALSVYQRRIQELTRTLERERASKDAEVAEAARAAGAAAARPVQDDSLSETKLKLLELKNQVLELKEFYVDLIEKQYREGM